MDTLKSIGFVILVIIAISLVGSLLLDLISLISKNMYVFILAIAASIFLYKITKD